MFTEVKTTNFLKIYDPFKDGVLYKDKIITISLLDIKKAITQFKNIENIQTNDLKTEFCFNFLMYLYNSNEKKAIKVDLNQEDKPIISGIFELIKNIYNKENSFIVNFSNQENNNDIFIKKEKLISINEKYEQANDEEFHEINNNFYNTDEIIIDNRFFWKSVNIDILNAYEKLDIIINSYDEDDTSPDGKGKLQERIFELFKNNQEEIQTDDFKHYFLQKISNNHLIFYLNDYFDENNEILPNFNKNDIFEIIKYELLKNKKEKFFLDDFLFAKENSFYLSENIKKFIENNISNDEKISFLNSQIIIDYLETNTMKISDTKFNYIYKNLNLKNQEKFIDLFIKSNTRESYGNEPWIDTFSVIQYVKIKILDNKDILSKFIKLMDSNNLIKFFHQNKYKNDFLNNIDLLLTLNLSDNNLFSYIDNFKIKINKKDMDKILDNNPLIILNFINNREEYPGYDFNELLVKVIQKKPDSYEKIANSLPSEYIVDLLLNEDLNLDKNMLNYIFLYTANTLFILDPEKEQKIKEKYHTITNSFIEKRWSGRNPISKVVSKNLKKVNNENNILEILDSITSSLNQLNNHYNQDNDYSFNAIKFYENLSNELKQNQEITIKIIKMSYKNDKLDYNSFSPALKLNFDFNIKLISLDSYYISDIPIALYNNKDFSLKIAELLDKKPELLPEFPDFIQIFFNNVEDNYHNFLKTYILYHTLEKDITKQLPQKTNKLTKI